MYINSIYIHYIGVYIGICVCVCLCQPVYRKPAGFGQLVKLKHPKLIYATPTLKRSTMPPGSPHSVYLLSL